MSKTQNSEIIIMLQRKNKEQEAAIKTLKTQAADLKKGESGAEGKIKALNEIHSQKTKALLKSINLLKKEIQKIKYEGQDNVRHQKNIRLQKDIDDQEFIINQLRKMINDEDKCNQSILAALKNRDGGMEMVRVLNREELKIEIAKFKNISLKIIKDYQKNGIKIPGYAGKIAKEMDDQVKTGIKVPIGSKAEKVKDNGSEDFEGSMFGDSQSEAPSMIEEEIPEKVLNKIDKLEEHTTKLNIDLKEKNEKIIELMGELEDVKIQVFARDKSVELQQKQIEELLEELRESKGFENDIKILMQKNMALDDENGRLKTELQQMFMEGTDNANDSDDLLTINKGLTDQVKDYQQKITEMKARNKKMIDKLQSEVKKLTQEKEEKAREGMSKADEIEKVKSQAFEKEQKAQVLIEQAMKDKVAAESNAQKAQKEALEKVKKSESQSAEQVKQQEAAIKAKYEQEMQRLNKESLVKIEQLEKSKKVTEEQMSKKLESQKNEMQKQQALNERQIANEKQKVSQTQQALNETKTTQKKETQEATIEIKQDNTNSATRGRSSAEDRQKAIKLEKQKIAAEEEADELKIQQKLREQLEKQQKIIEFSRSKSKKKGESSVDKMSKTQVPKSSKASDLTGGVNLSNQNAKRPPTAAAGAGMSKTLAARDLTPDVQEKEKKAQDIKKIRKAQQEKAEAMEREDELKKQLEIEQKQAKIANIKNRTSLSPSPNKKMGAGAFEDDD